MPAGNGGSSGVSSTRWRAGTGIRCGRPGRESSGAGMRVLYRLNNDGMVGSFAGICGQDRSHRDAMSEEWFLVLTEVLHRRMLARCRVSRHQSTRSGDPSPPPTLLRSAIRPGRSTSGSCRWWPTVRTCRPPCFASSTRRPACRTLEELTDHLTALLEEVEDAAADPQGGPSRSGGAASASGWSGASPRRACAIMAQRFIVGEIAARGARASGATSGATASRASVDLLGEATVTAGRGGPLRRPLRRRARHARGAPPALARATGGSSATPPGRSPRRTCPSRSPP